MPRPSYPSTQSTGQYATVPPAPTYSPPPDPNAGVPWQDPAGGGPGGPGYSPGPALRPIDGGGARWLGPLLALVILAAVVGTVIFVVVRLVGGDDPRDPANVAGPNATQVAAAVGSPTADEAVTEEPENEPSAEAEATEAPAESTQEPTAESGGGDEEAADEEPSPTPTAEARPISARQMLPTSSDLPEGFTLTEDDKRTRDAVAASFANPEEALANLDDWDWRENAFRTFENGAAEAEPSQTSFVNISIHRFGERTGTAKAVDYFADAVVTGQGLEPVDVDPIGDETVLLRGAPDGVTLVVLYVREGNYLIRIGASSQQGDPTDLVIDVANAILD